MKEGLSVVGVFETAAEAHLALHLVEECEIEGFVGDESLTQLAWHFGQTFGGVKLYVWENDASEATRILDEERKRAFVRKEIESGGILRRAETPRGAARIALLAMIMPPLAFYSIFLAYRVLFVLPGKGLTRKEKTEMAFAVGLSILIIGTAVLIILKLNFGV